MASPKRPDLLVHCALCWKSSKRNPPTEGEQCPSSTFSAWPRRVHHVSACTMTRRPFELRWRASTARPSSSCIPTEAFHLIYLAAFQPDVTESLLALTGGEHPAWTNVEGDVITVVASPCIVKCSRLEHCGFDNRVQNERCINPPYMQTSSHERAGLAIRRRTT